MSKAILNFIDQQLTSVGINYEFGEWKSKIVYPYFVGEYTEIEPMTEDGYHESDFILTGFARGRWADLEEAAETIENLFTYNTSILGNGSGVDVSFSGSTRIPTGDEELKRIQINLKIKEWRVFND